MPSSSRPTSRTVNAAQLVSMFLAFLLVAGVGGVLSAGFLMPAAASLGAVTDAGKRLFEDLPTELGSQKMSEQSVVYAADGSVLARLFRWNRIVVPLDEISEHLQDAVVATEDRRFYEHGGVDPEGILRAAVQNLVSTSTQGGSTLTQQYVKNVLVEAGRRSHDAEAIQEATAPTLGRKLREAKLAIALENHASKDEILEGYLNIAQFGPSTWGVEAASRYYFSKHASELSIAQSAMLAGITQSPAKWDPVRNPDNALERRNTVLSLMLSQDKITQEEYDKAVDIPIKDMLDVNPTPNGCDSAGHAAYFCSYVRKVILTDPTFGETREDREQLLETGGLQIHTTLDPEMQKQAWETLTSNIPVDDASGISNALSTVEPGTGKIRAMAQNTPFGVPTEDQPRATRINFNADYSHGGSRGFQSGSSFKAFVLAQWLKDGHSLHETVNGSSNQVFPASSWDTCLPKHASTYSPNNLESVITGRMSALTATKNSVNTAFVWMENQMNLCDLARTAESMGFHHATVDPGEPMLDSDGNPIYGDFSMKVIPSMALGSNEVAPLTMATAFATFASGGTFCKPIAIESITTTNGKELDVPDADCHRVLEPEIAHAMNYALQEVVSPGATGENAILPNRPAAGKTGTANEDTAAWFIGYVPQLATAVWVGHSEGTESMFGATINGVYHRYTFGGAIAAPIWQEYMSAVTSGMEPQGFEDPRDREVYGEKQPVPDVSGMSPSDAEATLTSAGFDAAEGGRAYNDSVPEGAVITSDPSAGTELRPGSTVNLVISEGPEPQDESEGDGGDDQGNNGDQGNSGDHGNNGDDGGDD